METLKLDRKTAIQLYPTAAPEFRKMLQETFGERTFSGDICDRVQSLEDACAVTGKSASISPDLYIRAEENIEIFAEAMREGKPAGACYYYPYFIRSAGGGFSFRGCGGDRGYSSVGARLRVPDEKTARHMGTVMIEHYKTMDKG